MKTAPHHGVIVPLVTPATADGRLDEAGAERLVAHVAASGCGLLVAGTTGEVASLPDAVRRRFVEIAVRVAAGRVPVFACVAHNCLADSVALAREHLRQGADAVVAMLPNYFKLEPAEMRRYFEQLADATPGPVYLYNIPATVGMSIPLEVIEAVSARANVIGLKDSESAPGRKEALAERFAARADFALFMGAAAHSAAALRLGFRGFVPSSGNYRPDLAAQLYAAARAGDWPRAEQLQQASDAVGAVYQKGRTLGQSLAALKAMLAERGLCGPDMFPPLAPLDAEARAALRAQLAPLT
ncbi:dihydrodipicolinate synthase family protein [Oleiharenicola sp. Vm1]|uniref:dihydrodipicolinate synthase family protein n=1 Tax=Oleiharenicola sp. Vm1 TaxID=3398393 RepID=UPI0039F47424